MPITSSAITDKSALATLGDSKESHSLIGRRPISLRPYQQEAREAARKMIDRIAANMWRIPFGIVPAAYTPDAQTSRIAR